MDEGFLPFAQKYKGSQDAFFEDYKKVGGLSSCSCSLFFRVVLFAWQLTPLLLAPKRLVLL